MTDLLQAFLRRELKVLGRRIARGDVDHLADISQGEAKLLGAENEAEDELGPDKTPREAVGRRRRFAIFRRDGFRCQLCGASHDGNTKLHVDHKVPLAKGGSNEDDNLWTLCEDCNLGKSDALL